jgi:hypothetical protein
MAFILSLPIVLLLWSVISFTVGIIAFNFRDAPRGISFAVVAVLVVIFGLVLLVLFALWYIWGAGSIQVRVTSFLRPYFRYIRHSFKKSVPSNSYHV